MTKQYSITLLLLLVIVSSLAAENETSNHHHIGGSGVSNQTLDMKGFMKKTKVISADQSIIEKLKVVRIKMKTLRSLDDRGENPKTLDEAAEYLWKHISMAYPPGACVEYEGVFYFSGGMSTDSVTDFSSGFAIIKGKKGILSWEKEKNSQKKKQTSDR